MARGNVVDGPGPPAIPVPDSPLIRTRASVSRPSGSAGSTRCMAGLRPMICSSPCSRSRVCRSSAFSSRRRRTPDLPQRDEDHVVVERLQDVVEGALLDGVHRGVDRPYPVTDHLGVPAGRLQLVEELHARHHGHPDVGDQHVEGLGQAAGPPPSFATGPSDRPASGRRRGWSRWPVRRRQAGSARDLQGEGRIVFGSGARPRGVDVPTRLHDAVVRRTPACDRTPPPCPGPVPSPSSSPPRPGPARARGSARRPGLARLPGGRPLRGDRGLPRPRAEAVVVSLGLRDRDLAFLRLVRRRAPACPVLPPRRGGPPLPRPPRRHARSHAPPLRTRPSRGLRGRRPVLVPREQEGPATPGSEAQGAIRACYRTRPRR